nr:AAA family ATPase [Photobacterium phosphoreum]
MIYIYVDNYKILKDKEISLSSSYNVTRYGNSFIINDTSISDGFYGYNLDVISIFGKNGSGKSTIIELITLILSNQIPLLTEVVCLYEHMGRIYYFTNKSEHITVEYKYYMCPEIYIDDFLKVRKMLYIFLTM